MCAICGKEDYVYVAFENDNCLYAYLPDLSECIRSKSLPFTGFKFKSIKSYQDSNFATFYSTYGELGGMTYFAGWSDEEFFSDDPWVADIEQPLYKETHIQDGENFSILLELPVVENYGTVARHALAGVTDAIYKHAVYREKPYSENFNGKIELRLQNSDNLSQQQKDELEKSCLNRAERGYSLYLSPVTESSCVLSINFA